MTVVCRVCRARMHECCEQCGSALVTLLVHNPQREEKYYLCQCGNDFVEGEGGKKESICSNCRGKESS